MTIVKLKELSKEDKNKFYSGYLPEIAFNYTEDFIKNYPEFLFWMKSKVIDNEDKEILLLKDKKIPIGFSILKYSESKICSFYILPYFRNKHYSSILIEECFKNLNITYPLITVSKLVKDNFTNLFSKYNFRLITELDNLYKENSIEYIFNKEFIR